MSFFAILYWIVVVLAIFGIWAPAPWSRINTGSAILLFILLGVKVYPIALR